MGNQTTQMNADTVKQSVDSFKKDAKDINDSLTAANDTVKGVNSSTQSIWITDYSQKVAGIVGTEVADAVAQINEAASKLEAMAAEITKEDRG